MWIGELDAFEALYLKYKDERTRIQNPSPTTATAPKKADTKKHPLKIRKFAEAKP
jgi:hypothetical protein